MSIIRAPRPERGYVIVDNEVARDSRLSYRARGVLLSILSRPDSWRTDSTQLAREGTEGREAVRAALRELETVGYIVRRKRRGERGQWVTATVVYDSPQGIPAGGTGDGFPGVGGPGVGNPDVGGPGVGGLGAIQTPETEDRDVLSVATADAGDGYGTADLLEIVEERTGPSPVQILVGAYVEAYESNGGKTSEAVRGAAGRNIKRLLTEFEPAVILLAVQRAGAKRSKDIDRELGEAQQTYDRHGAARKAMFTAWEENAARIDNQQIQIGA